MSVSSVSGSLVEDPLFATLDYIPLVSTISGVARVAFGALEVALGAVVLPAQVILRICNVKHRFLLNIGVSNIVRGTVGATPITGNIALYIYDHTTTAREDIQNMFGISKFS